MAMKRRGWLGLIALVLVVLSLLALKTCSTSPYKDLSLVELLELYRAELDTPGLDTALAAENLQNADAAFAFVRDDIVFSPYVGRVQSPADVLNSRVANTVDKAALLGALLKELGWQVSYQRAKGDKISTVREKSSKDPSKILTEIARRIGYDLSTLDQEWQSISRQTQATRGQVADLVAGANKVLSDKIGYDRAYSSLTDSVPLGDRIVVVATRDGEDRSFDPVYFDAPLPEKARTTDIPPIREPVLELRLADGSGFEQSLLRLSGALAGRDITLSFVPAIDPIKRLAGPVELGDIKMWQPVLTINGQVQTGKPFTLSGRAPGLALSPPIADPQAFELADPASVTDLKLARISAENWPRVTLSLKVKSSAAGVWAPAHFTVTDNGQAVQPRLLNINQSTQPVLVLSDVSYSMQDIGAFEISKSAIVTLAQFLSPETPVGLTGFSGAPVNMVPIAPLGDGLALTRAAQLLKPDSFTGIYVALAQAARQENLDNGVVILLSDGADNVGGNEAEINAALNARNIRVFALALGADADAALLRRIAANTGGEFARIRTAAELKAFYARLGSELSSFITLDYDASSERPKNGLTHNVLVTLNETSLADAGTYVEPARNPSPQPPRLVLHIEVPVGNEVRQIDRTLIDLADGDARLALTGSYNLIGDLGGYPARRLTSAYIAEWIGVLRFIEDGALPPRNPAAPSYENMRMVNAFRALSTFGGEVETQPAAGPNLYLRRSTLRRNGENVQRLGVFDVLMRGYRANGGVRTSDVQDMEIASAIAEGMVLGGSNGIEALLGNSETITVSAPDEPLPDWMAPALRGQLEVARGVDDVLLASRQAPRWVWQAQTNSYHNFRVLYGDGPVYAKGASVEEIARVFDRIDKMYQLYDTAVGNYAGLYAAQGGLLSVAASIKRQENKLWCYSSVMMGYVGDAIESEDGLLNRQPAAAKANAARLCKIEGNPDDGVGFIKKAARNAAENGVNSFATNVVKDAAGDAFTAAHSAWTLGGALNDAAISYSARSGQPLPVTPGFHRAMAVAVEAARSAR